jgi:nicotinate phosphoribosyltransferase
MAATNGIRDTMRPVQSILDTDLYKLTMQQAVLKHFPDANVSYRFTNRSKGMVFSKSSVEKIKQYIIAMSELALTDGEGSWLRKTCPYLGEDYLAYLKSYRFRPAEQVSVEFEQYETGETEQGQLVINVQGTWAEVILYEVPLMSIISETYFTDMDTQWTLRGQRALARSKARQMISAGIKFSEFGSRRRRSFATHKMVIEGLLQGEKDVLTKNIGGSQGSGKLVGTSNVHLARLFGLNPVGTMAHEWTMGIAALQGYDRVNLRALQLWDAVYSPPNFVAQQPGHDLTIALTDTFSTRVFWDDLLSSDEGKEIARRWRGLRQDSGDSKAFAKYAKEQYAGLQIDSTRKMVIYSDALTAERCLELSHYSDEIGIGCSFGVGTNLTNDFLFDPNPCDPHAADPDDVEWVREAAKSKDHQTSKALNIVIKLHSVNGRNAVKISDELTKNTGDPEEIRLCKRRFGIDTGIEDSVEDA